VKEVLIIEDDGDIADLVAIHLRDMDCNVSKTSNGRIGYEKATDNTYDLIILDIMLPEMDGLEICRRLRKENNTSPIVMLTSKTEEMDKITGFEYGADMYATKPFNIIQFKAMLKALFRRIEISRSETNVEQCEVINADSMTINITKRSLHIKDQRIELTPKEFDLLALLAAHPGHSYSREQLLSQIWGYEYHAYEHTVNSHINRLRAKIEPDVANPKFVLTSWGVGYRFADGL
jgi:DNA-binding response OmpR family regulator